MFRQPPKMMNEVGLTSGQIFRPEQASLVDPVSNSEQQPSNVMMHNKNFLSSNILLNRILEKHNVSHAPMGLNTRNFYSNLDLMTIRWAASLNRRMPIIFFFEFFLSKSLFRRQMCRIFRRFFGNNSYYSTYLWYFNCKFINYNNNQIIFSIVFSRINHHI